MPRDKRDPRRRPPSDLGKPTNTRSQPERQWRIKDNQKIPSVVIADSEEVSSTPQPLRVIRQESSLVRSPIKDKTPVGSPVSKIHTDTPAPGVTIHTDTNRVAQAHNPLSPGCSQTQPESSLALPSLVYPTLPGKNLPHLENNSAQPSFTFGSFENQAEVQKVLPRTPSKKREVRSTPAKQVGKTSEEGSQFAFLWHKEPTQPSELEPGKLSTDLLSSLQNPPKRGHRTSSIPKNFWEAADLLPLPNSHVRRGRIFPLLLTCTGTAQNANAIRILAENDSPLKHPVAMRQLTVLESQESWKPDEARELLLNETSLSLRKVIVNKQNQYNPIRQWKDATWYFKWLEDDKGNGHCVIIPFVAIITRDLPLQKPERHKWQHVPPALKSHLMTTAERGKLLPFPDSLMGDFTSLLGDHLFGIDPSPVRPDFKKQRQTSDFDLRNKVQLGDDDSEGDRLGQPHLDGLANIQPE